MIDLVEIDVKAGDGGKGCISFRREKFVPRGGPDGGSGGRGGSVYVLADRSVTTLIDQHLRKHYDAGRGGHGMGKTAHGPNGSDAEIVVPVGTIIHDAGTGERLGELLRDGERLMVARGGYGGRGNVEFKTSSYQAPRVAELGEPGQARRLRLEVKLIADVGLVGFPNVGKSTLLSHISEAKPKIAPYPFTTLEPNLGVARVGQGKSFVVADLPGLIEGAHQGVGLGHDFLRHVERTKLLLHVVDAASVDGRDPIDDIRKINRELRLHSDKLADLPQLIVFNKLDLPDAQETLPLLQEELKVAPVYAISAATGDGVPELVFAAYAALKRVWEREESEAPTKAQPVEYRDERSLRVFREEDGFRVEGDKATRAIVMTDFENDEAVWLLQRRLNRMGLWRALRRAKARDGDTVRIGDSEFVFTGEEHAATIAEFLAAKRQAPRRESRNERADRRNAPPR